MNSITKSYMGFYVLSKLLQGHLPHKQANNIVSATHAVGASALCYSHLWKLSSFTLFKNFSTGYFLHDAVQLAYSGKLSTMNLAFLYHHLSAIYLLNSSVNATFISNLFFWAEISNFPTYPLYHYLHKKEGGHEEKIKCLRYVQKIVYTCIRIILLTQMIHNYLNKKGDKRIPLPLLGVLPVYFMGLTWTYKILSQ